MYDVTVVYPGAKGEQCPQNEKDLLQNKFPEKIHFHIRRFQEWFLYLILSVTVKQEEQTRMLV